MLPGTTGLSGTGLSVAISELARRRGCGGRCPTAEYWDRMVQGSGHHIESCSVEEEEADIHCVHHIDPGLNDQQLKD